MNNITTLIKYIDSCLILTVLSSENSRNGTSSLLRPSLMPSLHQISPTHPTLPIPMSPMENVGLGVHCNTFQNTNSASSTSQTAASTLTAPATLPTSATYLTITAADGLNQIRFLLDEIYVKRCSNRSLPVFFQLFVDRIQQ